MQYLHGRGRYPSWPVGRGVTRYEPEKGVCARAVSSSVPHEMSQSMARYQGEFVRGRVGVT